MLQSIFLDVILEKVSTLLTGLRFKYFCYLFLCFSSLVISMEGVPGTMVIQPGQHILIEGEDDDNPYVARVLQLFGDGESLAGGCTTTPKR